MPARRNGGGSRAEAVLAAAIAAAVEASFHELRRSVRKTLSLVCTALVAVMAGARSGAGRLSLAALYRGLPVAARPHSRENRLRRFLDNPRLEGRAVSTGLGRLLGPRTAPGFCPVLIDQTTVGPVQLLIAAIPCAGRAVPLALYTFTYPWQERLDSQNQLEEVFLGDVAQSLPPGLVPVFIGDRGYSRAALLASSLREGRWILLRGRAGTVIEWQGRRQKLGELSAPARHPVRYADVRYHAHRRVPVDVIALHEPGFAEPWYLLVPSWTRAQWTPAEVVAVYRQRMQIEQSFRDFKTHLGIRGLQLKVRVAERLGRLLLAFCLAYALLVFLGLTPAGQAARAELEVLRRTPRHGTRRTLSVLSIATLMLTHAAHAQVARRALCALLHRWAAGQPPAALRGRGLPRALGPPSN